MNSFLHAFREYPAVAGVAVFVTISLGLALFFGYLMQRSGMSLRPLIFFFGFIAIVGLPQAVVHLLDARAHAGAASAARAADAASMSSGTAAASLQPVAWTAIFGASADPSLITDAKRGLDAIVADAQEAKLSFSPDGSSALAARFDSPQAAAAALDRYGTFFQFSDVTGSDAQGWTARRYRGQGEWTHVVAVGPELYAWSGATREAVEERRRQALGFRSGMAAEPAQGAASTETRIVSRRLAKNVPLMSTFLVVNVALAAGWFFKGSAWSARTAPAAGAAAVEAQALRERILSLNTAELPFEVRPAEAGDAIEVTWRYADARWFDLMRAHQMRRAHKLVLTPDASSRTVRVREFISAFDGSAGLDGIKLQWHASRGMQFFQVEHTRVFGAQLDPEGRPNGQWSAAYTFDLQSLKAPVIDAVVSSGWSWQPVMWEAPACLRWLTE